ncbi:YrdB family protein [Diaminobutyricimonas sp. TR449]|uniref:YrdB family protein n=1 Tax=Diaminobutyricimonas sp. TR449 TaxID=2708076 RepID=UPI001422CA09|nr:YrdB family protein [Diaminobutyricimonas sp. TR449]
MSVVVGVVLLLKFLVELASLVAVGYWGYHLTDIGILRWVLALAVPAVVAVLWSIWIAPKADHRLDQPWLVITQLAVFGLAALALWASGQPGLAVALGSAAVVIEVLLLVTGQYSE